MLLALIGSWAWANQAVAQGRTTFGNEWINYAQPYYKIQVAQNGIYRLSHDYLTQAGISGVDPRTFQLFRRGKEVAIHVSGEADGQFGPADFIEFYGEKNDGKLDVELYKDPAHQIHRLYSLYTDTAAYFLTWGAGSGKRMAEQNANTPEVTPSSVFYHTQSDARAFSWTYGKFHGQSRMPWMDAGEGFLVSNNTPINYTFSGLKNVETTGFKPQLDIAIEGGYPGAHSLDVFVVLPSGGTRLIDNISNFSDYESRKRRYSLEFSDIAGDGTLKLRFTPKASGNDWVALRFIQLKYPNKLDLNGKATVVSPDSNSTAPSYFLFNNPPALARAYDITDTENIVRVSGKSEGTKTGFVFPASGGRERKFIVVGGEEYLTPLPAVRRGFRKIVPKDHNYIIVSHKKLTAPAGNYQNPPRDYAAYRASAIGGGYDTLVVLVDQLYDQFHYGDRSPSGIRRFMKFMQSSGNPQYLLLLGKGLDYDYRLGYFRTKPFTATEQDLVPVGGSPGSDIFFTADWQKDSFVPAVATGRVSAFTSVDIVSYLEKVKLQESLGTGLEWRKNVLHLGGGQTEQEIKSFKHYLSDYERRAEKPLFGGKVFTISRNSTRDIVTNINVSKEVNQGLSLITFFGHSSSTVSDIDIGNVSNNINGYRNRGKYPMILMNGCGSGNAFLRYSFGEDWILTPERGAILFLAHSNIGYPHLLNLYSSNFYETAFNNPDFYGKSVGSIQQEVIKKVSSVSTGAIANAMAMQMVLQGDPAVSLYSPEKPDYEITDQSLSLQSLDGGPVTITADKFQLAVDVKNLGKATTDSIFVSVKQTLPDGKEILVDSVVVAPIFYRDTILVHLNSPGVAGIGINKFEVFVDHTNKVEELNENNNIGRLEYFFNQTGISALYPQEYSIVNSTQVKLTGMAATYSAEEIEYYFQIDTTYHFKSPLKTETVKAGMVPVWEVNLQDRMALQDSLVYFWRFRLKEITPGADTVWAQSSFRYIQNSSPGWSQSHFGQFSKAVLKDLQLETSSQSWSFGEVRKKVEIRGIGGNVNFSYPPYGIFIDGKAYFNNSCGYGKPNLLIAVFHPQTLELFNQMPAGLGSVCGTEPKSFYHFVDLGVAANQEKLESFLKSVPNGYYVAMLSVNKVPFSSFSESLKAAFGEVGSSLIKTLETGQPFALVGKKGNAIGASQEVTFNPDDPTAPASQTVTLFSDLTGKGSQGAVASTRIGPATEWYSLFHQVRKEGMDTYTLKVIGIDQDGKEKVLFNDVKASSFALNGIDASLYPYLQLIMLKADAKDHTAPQLKQWLVTYKGLPEGVVRPDAFGKDQYDLAKQPAKSTITLPFVFENISDYAFKEPLTVEVSIFKANGEQSVQNISLRPLPAHDTLPFDYSFSTDGLVGENRMRVFFNPKLLPEQSYVNNIFEFSFKIGQDELHPVLDVAFDGLHIMDGEIVSPSPVISMTLKDENKLKPIEDPNLMEIFLKRPGGSDFEVINMANNASDVQYSAGDERNPFRLDYNPKNLPDGIYELRVQGKDVAGNLSGIEMYRISFEVINESSITRFYPYPNPFSSNTRFIFTLTGSTVPEDFKIQIMTITGKVIREIRQDEIGPIRIGNNISQFAWDGSDEFGDKLANGVYLYRVVMDRKTDEFKQRHTAGDKAFKHEYGKLYILR
jgi:hypothetical protein